jgi:cytochrome b subunit of formate dehydrogenase
VRGTHKKIPRPRPGEVFDQRQQLTLVLLILAAVLSAFSGLLLLLTRLLTAALLLAGLVVATLLLLVRTLVRILLVRIVHILSCFGFSPQLTTAATTFRS